MSNSNLTRIQNKTADNGLALHWWQAITWTNNGFVPRRISILSVSWRYTWWRHQMETFSALLAICAGNSPVPGEFPTQRPVTRGFDVFFDLRLNKRLGKQSWGWLFETLSCPLWRHHNETRQSWLSHNTMAWLLGISSHAWLSGHGELIVYARCRTLR